MRHPDILEAMASYYVSYFVIDNLRRVTEEMAAQLETMEGLSWALIKVCDDVQGNPRRQRSKQVLVSIEAVERLPRHAVHLDADGDDNLVVDMMPEDARAPRCSYCTRRHLAPLSRRGPLTRR